MTMEQGMEALRPLLGDVLLVSANGYISRTAFHVGDRPENFYMLGSMGLASSIALGVALSRPERRVVVYDGDGNLLTNLGAVPMVAYTRPRNLVHVVFDNSVYASTGNQPTISREVPLERMAAAAGYARSVRVRTAEELAAAFRECLAGEGPAFILAEIEVERGPFTYSRVTLTPEQIRERFSTAVQAGQQSS